MEPKLDTICKILEKNYKGVYVPFGAMNLDDEEYLIIDARKVQGFKAKNMAYAAKRILTKFPEIVWVHFTGGWFEHVYSRDTLRWGGLWK
jgi:hypothetical protein